MTILDSEGIQAQIDGMPDGNFDVPNPEGGSIVCPITDKHVTLAMNFFKNNWRPGKRFDLRELSRMSACRDDPEGGPRDFTADGIPVGMKLSPKQIKWLLELFISERAERFPPAEPE